MKKSKSDELTEIVSARDAQERSEALTSIWSRESQLSQRVLIYVARLLEEQNRYLLAIARQRVIKKRRTGCRRIK